MNLKTQNIFDEINSLINGVKNYLKNKSLSEDDNFHANQKDKEEFYSNLIKNDPTTSDSSAKKMSNLSINLSDTAQLKLIKKQKKLLRRSRK